MVAPSPPTTHVIRIPKWLNLARLVATRKRALLWMTVIFLGLIALTVGLALASAALLADQTTWSIGIFMVFTAGAVFVLAFASGWTWLTKLAGAIIENRRRKVR